MYTPEHLKGQIDGLDALLHEIARRSPEALAKLEEVHANVFGKTIDKGCGNCLQKAYKKLKELTIEKLTEMLNRKYILNDNVVLQYPAFGGDHYTNANLTDDVAKAILKESPELAVHFKDLPEEKPEKKEKDGKEGK